MHNLKGLSDEHIWTAFKRLAFSGRTHEFYDDLKVIGGRYPINARFSSCCKNCRKCDDVKRHQTRMGAYLK